MRCCISKKEKILKEALKLFAIQGVGNTSTAEITKRAGVAEGTLFVHYKNKQALVDALFLHVKKQQAEVFESCVADITEAEEFVRTLAKTVTQHFLKNYDELIFIENVKFLNLVSKEAVCEMNKHFKKFEEKMHKLQESGKIKPLDMELFHHMMWSMIVALVHYCKKNKKKVTDELLDPVWDAVRFV